MTNSFQMSQTIHVAATLGIADLLAEGPRTADELAEATGTHAPTLYRFFVRWPAWVCSPKRPTPSSS
jgi:hypothetical protein